MCFSLEWVEQLLIWLVIVGAIVAILRLLIPWALSFFGFNPGPIMQIINIVIGAIVVIFVIYFVFAMIACLSSMGGGLSLFPRH